jgi:UDP-N-acetylmuramate: L-alanyl-gamma-D-glutamyl-meso-diaminopimelate ligase
MEVIYSQNGLTIYDDFAHHPTAIQTTLAGLRRRVGDEAIMAILEPGSHTMRKGTHLGKLAPAVAEADKVIWFKPENMQWDMNTELASKNSLISSNIPDIIESAISTIKQENIKHLVIMSNSGFQGIHNLLVDRLGQVKD